MPHLAALLLVPFQLVGTPLLAQVQVPPPRGYVNDTTSLLATPSLGLTDARVGRIRDAMTPYLAREEYGAGLAYGVELIAQAFAHEFGVTLDAAPPPPRPAAPEVWLPTGATLFWIIFAFVFIVSILQRRRGRRGLPWWWVGGGWSRSGWGGGWGGGGGGGGGGFSGGFGGFGGGGGFSGGGAG